MTQKFKVGDKVRILDASRIISGVSQGLKDGDVYEVVELYQGREYDPIIKLADGHNFGFMDGDYNYIAKVSDKPTKKQRITTLEQQVAELTAKVEALEKAVKPSIKFVGTAEAFIDGKLFGKLKTVEARVLSANEQRKAIIAEAKAFVEDAKNLTGRITRRKGYHYPAKGVHFISDADFIVNAKKRTVVAILRNQIGVKEITAKTIAKCAPDDVFNADIGKAIALGRALGLDVKRFEQAVKPKEFTVGQIITFPKEDSWHMRHNYRIDKLKGDDALTVVFNSVKGLDYRLGKKAAEAHEYNVIIEDTDAQY